MTMFFAKKLNKKGFTLAEMLIVVAIIAILVAIAVPIFTNALDKANNAVFLANRRAVKSAGVVKILDGIANGTISISSPGAAQWYVKGTFDKNGDLTKVEIDSAATGESDYPGWASSGKTSITVLIKDTDLTS